MSGISGKITGVFLRNVNEMKIIDTYPMMPEAFEDNTFQLDKWEKYIDSVYPNAASIFITDMEKCIATGKFTWENDYLPVLNTVVRSDELREIL